MSRVFSNFNTSAAAATPAFPIGYPRRLRPGPRLPPQPDKRHRGHIVDTRHTDPTALACTVDGSGPRGAAAPRGGDPVACGEPWFAGCVECAGAPPRASTN